MLDAFTANNGIKVIITKREGLLKIDPSKCRLLVIDIP